MAVRQESEEQLNRVRDWVERIVVGWNLCPFARKEMVNDRICYQLSEARSEEELLTELALGLERLERDERWETTLLVHPYVLQDFDDYNQFLSLVDALLEQMDLLGVFQVASFHPDYRFEGTSPEDAENYTNRSPYPILHLIREESMARVLESYPEPEKIPERNIEYLRNLSEDELDSAFKPLRS